MLHVGRRASIPPFLCFQKYKSEEGVQMRFLGVACPAQGVSGLHDLVAVWRVQEDSRFQNYQATFTILRESEIPKQWLQDLVDGVPPANSQHCPETWRKWIESGLYSPLSASRTRLPRSKTDQMPQTAAEKQVLAHIFKTLSPREFEFLAAALVPMVDERFSNLTVTRAVRDGGRDVLGTYRVGHDLHQVHLTAYIEAKRWQLTKAVGVKPMMRLLARLKHRDLGVFLTTSFFEKQVQQELIEDNHPVLLVSGGDVVRTLLSAELGIGTRLDQWLARIRAEAAGDFGGGGGEG